MGKQTRFYMTPDDEQSFLEFARSDRDVAILKFHLPTPELASLESLPPIGEPFFFALTLWDRDHSPPPRLLHLANLGCYVVNTSDAEVIEFGRSFIHPQGLIAGRLWMEMRGLRRGESPSFFEKGPEFLRWYNRLATWIKRQSRRDDNGDYIMPGAERFVADGGQLLPFVPVPRD